MSPARPSRRPPLQVSLDRQPNPAESNASTVPARQPDAQRTSARVYPPDGHARKTFQPLSCSNISIISQHVAFSTFRAAAPWRGRSLLVLRVDEVRGALVSRHTHRRRTAIHRRRSTQPRADRVRRGIRESFHMLRAARTSYLLGTLGRRSMNLHVRRSLNLATLTVGSSPKFSSRSAPDRPSAQA